ncbi:alkaline phosphatase family protein [Paludisphaera rhizosphaerae]|uniref:alkaline phosphatase family protein n=1 Tax=Paludisphaera rhizosphaerae TaxID=2711216 RepID=UPI0013ECBFE9|nr:alkaline phosphatase family protein [Paludisphaera rhizosphaerae]
MKPKTILIGLDGATFKVLDRLMADGVTPFLRDLAADGVRATLRSVVPPLTPPAWTSLMTGKRPGEHGVFDFFQKETPDSRYFRFSSSHDVQAATIWSMAGDHGLRSNVLNFPLMFPPPAFEGCLVPGGWMPWRQLRLGCRPTGLFDRLKALPSFNPRELSHDMALEEKVLEGCAAEEYLDWISLHTRRERRWTEILLFLMKEEPADFSAILFDGVDKLQHLCWRFLDPALFPASPTPWEADVRAACLNYFRELDGLIAEIVGAAGSDATVLFASDHGFGPTSDIFNVNTWLERQGHLAWVGDRGARPDANHQVGINQIARHVYEMDWEKTRAYCATPSSQGIHIVRRSADAPGGVPDEDYHRFRSELVSELKSLRHPETGRPVVAEVWERDDVFAGPFEPWGPDLTIWLEDVAVVSILRADSVMGRRPEPAGTHYPEGIFMAKGPGVRRGESVAEMSLLDVAPFVLNSLGLPIPDDFSGRLPLQTLEQGWSPGRQAAARVRPSVAAVLEPVGADADLDEQEEQLILKRLSALGYLE